VVAEVVGSAVPPSGLEIGATAQHLVSLNSIEDDGLGEELQVVWELEPGARVHEKMALPEPTGFDDPATLDTFLDAVRWGAASVADHRSVQSPFRSGIDIEDYQLDPVVRAIQMPRVNLLIADDVGLGKTIETGMVIQELIIRHRARTALIVCPSSLQIQWRDQMRDKFGLEFRIVDSDLMKQLRRTRGLHVNPWRHFPRLITSIDYLKRDRPMRLFREVLPPSDEPAYPRKFDVLVVDEAHNVAPSGRGKYATDSLRTTALRVLAPHFEHKLFLTATPHNGYPESFTALLELLDNQRFARGVGPNRQQLQAVMVRRMKAEIVDWDGKPKFPERKLTAIEVDYTDDERRIHQALREYAKSRMKHRMDGAGKYAAEFVLKLLKKRLFSSPAAFGVTLAKHERTLQGIKEKPTARRPSEGILRRQISNMEEEFADDDVYEETTHDVVDTASRLFPEVTKSEAALLAEMRQWVQSASARGDSKAAELIRWLHENIKPKGRWSDTRVIIFTEYRATQNWLMEMLAAEGLTGGERLMTLYGGMPTDQREAIKAAFQAAPDESDVRVLLATDAASEGIDLQNHCSLMIHYEIPWNPNRLEQRNGRIDRHGQRAGEVLVHHFVAKGYQARQSQLGSEASELEADLEFLMRAAQKVETIRENLGKVGPVIAQQVEEAMLGRRTQLDTTDAEKGAAPVRRMLKFERDLQKRVQELHEQLHDTKRDLRLEPEHVEAVVKVGLRLAGQPLLENAELDGVWPDPDGKRKTCPVFRLPPFRGSWQTCLEGLSHPHTGEVRPIVFDHDLARGRDDVVLVHLNHRLVQMCLRLLRAEVWSQEERKALHRVTARLVRDSALDTPAVIAHARLVIIGGDSQRLHEEVFTAGGFLRKGKFSRMNEGQMAQALAAALDGEPPPDTKGRLGDLWPTIRSSMRQTLEARMKQRVTSLERTLADREKKDIGDITAILNELRQKILDELNQPEDKQLTFGFTESEHDQLRRNMDSLRARVARIPEEIEQETEAIRARFAEPQARLFPVSITYLVPKGLDGR